MRLSKDLVSRRDELVPMNDGKARVMNIGAQDINVGGLYVQAATAEVAGVRSSSVAGPQFSEERNEPGGMSVEAKGKGSGGKNGEKRRARSLMR